MRGQTSTSPQRRTARRSPVAWVLSLAPVAWFGRAISYPLYLWHVVFIAMIEPFVQGALGIVLVLAAAIVASYIPARRAARISPIVALGR